MAKVDAIRIRNEYRCGVIKCHALILTGTLNWGVVEHKCKCGAIVVIKGEAQKGPAGRDHRKPHERR